MFGTFVKLYFCNFFLVKCIRLEKTTVSIVEVEGRTSGLLESGWGRYRRTFSYQKRTRPKLALCHHHQRPPRQPGPPEFRLRACSPAHSVVAVTVCGCVDCGLVSTGRPHCRIPPKSPNPNHQSTPGAQANLPATIPRTHASLGAGLSPNSTVPPHRRRRRCICGHRFGSATRSSTATSRSWSSTSGTWSARSGSARSGRARARRIRTTSPAAAGRRRCSRTTRRRGPCWPARSSSPGTPSCFWPAAAVASAAEVCACF